MAAILPLGVFFILLAMARGLGPSWRAAFVHACVAWGVLLAFLTETLSASDSLAYPGVVVSWSLLAAVGLFFLWKRGFRTRWPAAPPFFPRGSLLAMSSMVILILGIVGLTAIVAPPNTMDSMVYHMVRVAHWVQNHNVSFFPTASLSNLYNPPWSEYAIAHFQILTHGDRLANGVQWWSMLGSVLGVSLIANQMGASARGQVFAAVFVATIPMGILQGSSTQNDYVVAFWLVCFLVVAMQWIERLKARGETNTDVPWALGAGASAGLALLTKGTAYIFVAPFAIWLMVVLLVRRGGACLKPAVLMGLCIAILNGPHCLRNTQLFGSPLALASRQERDVNQDFGVSVTVSNIVRNLSLHLGTPWSDVNRQLYGTLELAHAKLQRDLNDPRTTAVGRFRIHYPNTFEDSAGNPLHLVLGIVTLSLWIAVRRLRGRGVAWGYTLSLVAACLLFSALLKWQPWHSRLQLPLFALLAPLVGLVVGKAAARLVVLTAGLLFVSSLPWLLFNRTRSFLAQSLVSSERGAEGNCIWTLPRTAQYFQRGAGGLQAPYVAATDYLKRRGFREVGLWLPWDWWEYQFWVLLSGPDRAVQLESVMVFNPSGRLESAAFRPSAIVRVRGFQEETEVDEVRIRTALYRRTWSRDAVDVFVDTDCATFAEEPR